MRYCRTALFLCLTLYVTSGDALFANDDPLEPLNRRVGTWSNKIYVKKAEWTPEERTFTGEETIKWVLDQKFIQGDAIRADGAKGHFLVHYDAEAKVYRSWYFGNRNQFPRGDTVGRWDPKAERMDWNLDFGNGVHGKMIFEYLDKDTFKWSLVAHDANGKLMLDTGGTQTRKSQNTEESD